MPGHWRGQFLLRPASKIKILYITAYSSTAYLINAQKMLHSALECSPSMGEYKANTMLSAVALRSQIEATLASRIPSALTPAARVYREVAPVGIDVLDEMLGGGLPIAALTEMVGLECSGRTAVALSFVAQLTRMEKVCAWVDVSDALSPESAAAT